MFERWFLKVDNFLTLGFQILEFVIMLALVCGGFYVCWTILGDTDIATLPKLGWSIGAAVVSGIVGWVVWSVMKIFGSGF